MVLVLLVLQWTQRVLCHPPQSVCTGEPLPYQFEPKPSTEGNDISVDVPNEVHV